MTKRRTLTDEEFRAAAKAGTAPADAVLRKGFVTEVKAAEGEDSRALDFTISTASIDRMGDTIAVDGWDLAAYRKNPVVLWAHDPSMLPVGKASHIRVEDGKLKARAEFVPRSISGFADAVFNMLKAGFLSATSVGFLPKKYAFAEDADRRWGIDFLEQELLEFSIVPIPANAEALIEARAAGIETSPLLEWAEGLLECDGRVAVAKADLAELHRRAAAPERLAALFRETADRLPQDARGTANQLRRCANMAEREGSVKTPPPGVALMRQRLNLMRRRSA